jgi:hypothetical protein
MDNPGKTHWNALLQLLAYLRDTPSASITYRNPELFTAQHGYPHQHMDKNTFYCYVDSDLGTTDIDERKPVTGYTIFFNGGLIAWKTCLQKTVASSPGAAEWIGLHTISREIMWLRNITEELGYKQTQPTIIYGDSDTAFKSASKPAQASQLKHLELKYLEVRQWVAEKKIAPTFISRIFNIADTFCKNQTKQDFIKNRNSFIDIPSSPSSEGIQAGHLILFNLSNKIKLNHHQYNNTIVNNNNNSINNNSNTNTRNYKRQKLDECNNRIITTEK